MTHTEHGRRHVRKHGLGRKKSSRHRNSRSSRSWSRSKQLSEKPHTESDLTLEGDSTISMGAVPTSSPFGRLSTEYQDDLSDDEDEPAMHTSIRLLPSAPISPSIAVPVGDGYDALDVMADYLFRFGCEQKKWFQRPPVTAKEKRRTYSSKHVATGVCIRAKTGIQRVYPANLPGLAAFETAVTALNPEVAFKVKSPIVKTVMSTCITPDMAEFTINADTRIQILDELSHLACARKHQYAAFIRDEGVLCVWADAVENVVAATESLEQALIDFIWHQEQQTRKQGFAAHLDVHAQQEKEALNRAIQQGEKEADASEKTEVDSTMDAEDLAKLQAKQRWKERPVMLYDAVTAGTHKKMAKAAPSAPL
ncbi:hypothetical protein QFC19_000722 [Naganishia cerealis]|uniref:Uncharacterized protein n=1 Tax=Naganishia cerealis TaxID=610337 RepID=A0ACC2WLF7_9TREE|nr:hypothetical protein QFC19_000722 [Naganishia cerealis]